MKRYILTMLIAVVALVANAQEVTVKGTVISAADNEPMIGATVKVKGTGTGTVTDFDGNYTIKVDKNATLVFSMIGYKAVEEVVGNRYMINVSLVDDTNDLNEIVVIGYGVAKKGDLTSSISAIKGEKLEKLSTGNVMNALQGQVNGVQVTGSGGPGSSPRVIIRGVSTINGSDPLYVVDGMPVGTNINFLNQNDIESMQVLNQLSMVHVLLTVLYLSPLRRVLPVLLSSLLPLLLVSRLCQSLISQVLLSMRRFTMHVTPTTDRYRHSRVEALPTGGMRF